MKRFVGGMFIAVAATWSCGAKTGMDLGGDPLGVDGVGDAGGGGDAAKARPDATSPRPSPSAAPTGTKPDDVPTGPCRNVTGTWAGTWTTAGGSGTWRTVLKESASGALSGSSDVTGTVCGAQSSVSGRRDGCTITFGIADFEGCNVDFVGTLGGNDMAGTFSATGGAVDKGTWRGSKQ